MSSCLGKSSFCPYRVVPKKFNLSSPSHCLCKNRVNIWKPPLPSRPHFLLRLRPPVPPELFTGLWLP
uniref:Uncharacterized protein n=1 Tax=Arundo donax TaxID=35708 RepID=A0A0A9DMA1_ARUDO